MLNLMEKFRQFMRGRNGMDELYLFMLGLTFVLNVADVFVRSIIFHVIVIAFYLLTFFRFFSKDLYRRSRENAKFLMLKDKIVDFFKGKRAEKSNPDYINVKKKSKSRLRKKWELYKTKKKDKNHYYITCSGCKAVIRLKKANGCHRVECPKCGREIIIIIN